MIYGGDKLLMRRDELPLSSCVDNPEVIELMPAICLMAKHQYRNKQVKQLPEVSCGDLGSRTALANRQRNKVFFKKCFQSPNVGISLDVCSELTLKT